ncbi:MAG: putative Fe-S cluster assembly protein SufT [Verrucomicrobia bacterium]|nr:MAG: putative Fe-S cluster assembly protein SufT [Verrucomicrobiota bacterium]
MNPTPTIPLERDCEAVQIPAGNKVVLPAGTEVAIEETLDHGFTVRAMGALFRIDGRDADALGLEPREEAGGPTAPEPDSPTPLEDRVWAALRQCFDPEVPVNIVDLGLVYSVEVEPAGSPPDGSRVRVRMTLTAPGCGMGPMIAEDARQRILALPGVKEAEVELVWDPPWNQSMITPEGRRALGWE